MLSSVAGMHIILIPHNHSTKILCSENEFFVRYCGSYGYQQLLKQQFCCANDTEVVTQLRLLKINRHLIFVIFIE